MVGGIPFDNMPEPLRLNIIGTIINYILQEDMKESGFISQEVIEAGFEEYSGVSLNDACETIKKSFKDFVDEYFLRLFKNCFPHGLARLSATDKTVSKFDNFCAKAVCEQPASSLPMIKDTEAATSQSTSPSSMVIQEEPNTDNQQPSSSQSSPTPIESDAGQISSAEIIQSSEDSKDNGHDESSVPTAVSPSPSFLQSVDNIDEIPDLEEDFLENVAKYVNEKKEELNDEAEIKQNDDKLTFTDPSTPNFETKTDSENDKCSAESIEVVVEVTITDDDEASLCEPSEVKDDEDRPSFGETSEVEDVKNVPSFCESSDVKDDEKQKEENFIDLSDNENAEGPSSDDKDATTMIPPIITDELLDNIEAPDIQLPAKDLAPMIDVDDFLNLLFPSNKITPAQTSEQSESLVSTASAVPEQTAASSAVPQQSSASKPTKVVSDETLSKLINSADIDLNYDSDSSAEAIEYELDSSLHITNFTAVNEMKSKIAKTLPKPKHNHLLDFWLEDFKNFPEVVLFFQYLQYHVEQFGFNDCLTFKSYQRLVDVIIEREHVFLMLNEVVSNIPLMCQYKFVVYDDNYPDFIYINPGVLQLQIFPLAVGFPSSFIHLYKLKREWIISDLKKEFNDCEDKEFYRQLINFLNDRPDLIILQSPASNATFPEMSVILNDRVSLRLCCYLFQLKDLNVAESLHLRMDYINSMKQFFPQRPQPQT